MICTACGQENPKGFRFCGACAAPLAPGEVGQREERKIVTVLFADLVGFTSRSELMDVEDVRGTLAPYHALLREQLEHYGGTVEKFIGDAVMALFGAPVAHEDDPERAVRAALSIRAAIDRLNDEEPELDLHVRVGVNTGEALVVLSADAARGEGMASGDVVNTAARLQTAAPVDGILVGETTYHATDRVITYRNSESVVAKGQVTAAAGLGGSRGACAAGRRRGSAAHHPIGGARRGGRPAARCAAPLPLRARGAAGHACRRARHWQEPPGVGADAGG
jgi:class 3 adenylate cyclase